MNANRPLIEELSPVPEIEAALQAFSNQPSLIVLESALRRDPLGRYSFLTADPFRFVEYPRVPFGRDPFEELRHTLESFPCEPIEELPPFQGGAAGLLSYELGGAWEQLNWAQHDDFQLPDLAVGFYDWVLAWDHHAGRAWIISHGFPETEQYSRKRRAEARLQWVKRALQRGEQSRESRVQSPESRTESAESARQPARGKSFPAPGLPGLVSNFSREGYLQAVERVIEFIRAGDIFQANLSQRLLSPAGEAPLDLYERLRKSNPAPFAGYFAHRDWAILSSSPERFVAVREGEVETRPIKGTRRRSPGPEADLFTRDELRQSEKDRAENVMIVDLLRNDLSRVCSAGSIRVPRLCSVETYETVQHLVSEVRGRLAPGEDVWALLAAVFPGGSITGAPKVRAMEIIAELEPTVRGPYCGSLFYAGFNGSADSNILIRTLTCRRGWLQYPVGGGIVAQSNPLAEYEETLDKAEGMLRALRSRK